MGNEKANDMKTGCLSLIRIIFAFVHADSLTLSHAKL